MKWLAFPLAYTSKIIGVLGCLYFYTIKENEWILLVAFILATNSIKFTDGKKEKEIEEDD